MTEVNLAKRLSLFALIVLVALSAVACTRDKPEPAPATVVSPQAISTSSSSAPAVTPTSASVAQVTITPVTSVPITPTIVTVPPTLVPVPTTTPPATPTTASAPGTYTVKWGDWLNKIAAENGTTVQAILAVNPGLNPNRIYPGQVINLPAPGGGSSSSTSSAPSGSPSTYTVQRGDWLYALARRFGVSVAALLGANPGINPNFLFPGQVLNIPSSGNPPPGDGNPPPSSGTYTVQPGDTLFSIAVRFHTTIYALQIKNNLANPNFIYPGQVLTIPQ
jgi:LysM repeat protein